MYELDRQQFGIFVARLRKEKGYTQKEPSLVLRSDLWTKCPEVVATLPEK